MQAPLDGVITFYSWHHAMRAERVLSRQGFRVELIPTPRDLSSNCGTALRFLFADRERALRVLADSKVRTESSREYTPELEREPGTARAMAGHGPAGAGPGRRLRSWIASALGIGQGARG